MTKISVRILLEWSELKLKALGLYKKDTQAEIMQDYDNTLDALLDGYKNFIKK